MLTDGKGYVINQVMFYESNLFFTSLVISFLCQKELETLSKL